jgi:dsRNA-specific ribonuclease
MPKKSNKCLNDNKSSSDTENTEEEECTKVSTPEHNYDIKSGIKPLIYNENNILITINDIEKIINKYLSKKNKIKVDVNNLNLYIMALTHKSYTKGAYIVDENAVMNPLLSFIPKKKKYIINIGFDKMKRGKNVLDLRKKSYERLEFLGDSVIHYILGDYIYHRFVNDDEGLMTKVRTKLENSGKLFILTKALKLEPFIILAKQIEITKGRDKIISILEDVFESFIGAMHEEFGPNICKEFVINLIEDNIDITDLLENDDNYKDQLLRYYHIMKWPFPKYNLLSNVVNEDNNSRLFKVIVKDNNNRIIGQGIGGCLKKAEQMSAKMALEYLFDNVRKIDLTRNTKDV